MELLLLPVPFLNDSDAIQSSKIMFDVHFFLSPRRLSWLAQKTSDEMAATFSSEVGCEADNEIQLNCAEPPNRVEVK